MNDAVTLIAPDGREFVTTRREATRLNRTAGYRIKPTPKPKTETK